ncbi:MAG: tRNA lysidine(34) synthetase TilS [Ignavibacteriaceae bacterium]|nr:tRNA lysidine(34) synthetase TilS [Ignavibacteriaceae bacterium]
MHPLLKRTAGVVKSNSLLMKGDKVLVALSGGADSVFLFRFLLELRGIYQLELSAVHLNHLLRGVDSDADEEFCRTLCTEYEIPFYSRKASVHEYALQNHLSTEEAGRKLRYNYFDELMNELGYTKTATGHHQYDSAETVMFHLLRGSGLRGVSGIPAHRGRYIRPLLSLTPFEIRDWLQAEGYIWREDASNDSTDFTRNVIRNELFPFIHQKLRISPEQPLSRLAQYSAEIITFLDRLTDEVVNNHLQNSDGEAVYPAHKLRMLEPVLRKHALSRIFVHSGTEPSSSLVTDCNRLIESGESGVYQIGNGFSLFYSSEEMVLFRETENSGQEMRISPGQSVLFAGKEISFEPAIKEEINFSDSPLTEYIQSSHKIDYLVVRPWREGDKFKPLGMEGSILVSDFLNNHKVPSYKKRAEVVLTEGEEILAVAGRRISEKYKITGSGKFYYRIKCHEG